MVLKGLDGLFKVLAPLAQVAAERYVSSHSHCGMKSLNEPCPQNSEPHRHRDTEIKRCKRFSFVLWVLFSVASVPLWFLSSSPPLVLLYLAIRASTAVSKKQKFLLDD